jgi:hypothetical protein
MQVVQLGVFKFSPPVQMYTNESYYGAVHLVTATFVYPKWTSQFWVFFLFPL